MRDFERDYHKVDFTRVLCLDSAAARLERIVGCEGRISWKASLRLFAIAEEMPKYTFRAASDHLGSHAAPLKAASAAFLSSCVNGRLCCCITLLHFFLVEYQ